MPPHPRSLLLIEDDPVSSEVMQMILEMHGYTVATAEDGPSALKLLAEGLSCATILMDTQMPGLSGIPLIHALRQASPARILAISASDPGEALRAAANGFLLKPIQPEALAELLASPPESTPGADSPGAQIEKAPPESASSPQPDPVIDPIVFAKLKAMMPPASLREIYAATAADLKTRLASLETAMQAAKAPEVARIAHSIKGACAMVGLTSAREAAARLEITASSILVSTEGTQPSGFFTEEKPPSMELPSQQGNRERSSNLPVTWASDLAQLHFALQALEGMLADDFSA